MYNIHKEKQVISSLDSNTTRIEFYNQQNIANTNYSMAIFRPLTSIYIDKYNAYPPYFEYLNYIIPYNIFFT